MQLTDNEKANRIIPFFRLAFRPFFLVERCSLSLHCRFGAAFCWKVGRRLSMPALSGGIPMRCYLVLVGPLLWDSY